MSSTRPKPPGKYPQHWEAALIFLAASPEPREMLLEERLTRAQAHTQHAKARAIRQSVKENKSWGTAIRDMVKESRLQFRREMKPSGWQLFAYTTQPLTSIKELIENGLGN